MLEELRANRPSLDRPYKVVVVSRSPTLSRCPVCVWLILHVVLRRHESQGPGKGHNPLFLGLRVQAPSQALPLPLGSALKRGWGVPILSTKLVQDPRD